MSRVSSIELEGILNAWIKNVVPYKARITVTTSDSRYSRAVDFRDTAGAGVDSSIGFSALVLNFLLPQLFQRDLSGRLLRRLFAVALALCEAFRTDPHLDREYLFVF